MYNLLLINPSKNRNAIGSYKSTSAPPLSLAYIASLTPNNYNIQIIDEKIEPFIISEGIDIVGLTSYTSQIKRAYEIAEEFIKRGVTVIT